MHAFFARQRLSALLDGELSPQERAEVEALLAEDPELRAAYDGLRDAVALLGRAGPAVAPEGMAAEVAAARLERPGRRGPLVVAGLGLLAAVGVVAMLLPGDPPEPEELAALHAEIAAAPIEVASVASTPAPPPEPEPEPVPEPEPDPEPEPEPEPAAEPAPPPVRSTPKVERAPYQADWEQSTQLTRSRSVRLHASGGSVLFDLAELVAAHGGHVARGKPVRLDAETAYGQLTLQLPGASLPDFMAGVGTLGSLTSAPPHPADEDEESVELVVEVQYH